MNGKINYNGMLEIERTSYYKTHKCPFSPAEFDCGDWCPQFSEPTFAGITGKTELEICHEKILVFDEFKDKRTLNLSTLKKKEKHEEKMKNIQNLLKAECSWFKPATEEDFDKDDCGAVQFNRITNSYERICEADEAEAKAYISDTSLTEFVRANQTFQMHDKVSAAEYDKEFCYKNDADFDEEKVEEACTCRLIYQDIPNAEGSYEVIFNDLPIV